MLPACRWKPAPESQTPFVTAGLQDKRKACILQQALMAFEVLIEVMAELDHSSNLSSSADSHTLLIACLLHAS